MKDKLLHYMNARVPVLISGPPGVGKTAMVQALGRELGLHVETVIASIHDPVDFGGWPVVADGKFRLEPPPWFERLKAGGILFLDELTNAPRAVQAALLRVLLERVVGEAVLPDNVYIIAAANPVDVAADGWSLSLPMTNRLAHIEFKLDSWEWAQNFPTYWGNPPSFDRLDEQNWLRARSMVAAFISRRPELLLQMPKDETQWAWPSPRSWDHASRLMAMVLDQGVNAWAEYVVSCVGSGAAMEFINWATYVDLPDPEQIIANPHKAPVPDKPDQQFAVASALSAALQNKPTPDRWRAVESYTARLAEDSEDIAALLGRTLVNTMRDVWKMDPTVDLSPTLIKKMGSFFKRIGIIKE